MKYWRRHKHELEPDEHGGPPAPLPEKKLRYSTKDDVLLAQYFATGPTGTSDQIFQAFAKLVRLHSYRISALSTDFSEAPSSSMERMARTSQDT